MQGVAQMALSDVSIVFRQFFGSNDSVKLLDNPVLCLDQILKAKKRVLE
jgi:hypothetical protein